MGIAPKARAVLDQLAQAHGLPPVDVIGGSSAAFRMRARLAIRGRLGTPKLGLFAADSHRVVTIPSCSVHDPLINQVSSVVRRALVDARIAPYSDAARLGLARYLQVVVERSSRTAQVVVVGNSDSAAPFAACLDGIRAGLGRDLHSLWFNAQNAPTNTILGADFEHRCGPESVVEHFGGAAIHYPPGAFGQSNLEIAGSIIQHLRELVPRGARLAEFHAGVGAIGLSLVEGVSELRLNELGAHSLRGLELGLAALDCATRAKVSVHPGEAGAQAHMAAGADVVIVDPPRKGLDAALLARLSAEPPERLLYVSCGIDSLLADAARLTAAGTLRLAALTAFDLMPFTGHVETVAVFDR